MSRASSSSTALSRCSMRRWPGSAWPMCRRMWHGPISPRAGSGGCSRIGALRTQAITSTIRAAANPRRPSPYWSRRFASASACLGVERRRVDRVLTLEEDAEVLVEQDVGVEHDRAAPHLPRAVHLAQQILAATGEKLMIRLQVRAVHQKRGLGLDLAVLQRRRLEIADQVAGARRGILGPGHPAVEPGYPHLEIALILLEDRQISERRQLAVRFPARDVLAARHEVEDIVGEEFEPLREPALVEQPSLTDVELHQFEPQRLLRCQPHRQLHRAG